MSFLKLISDGFNSLNRGLEVISTELDELNREHKSKEPFREVKRKAHEIKHAVNLSLIIIPDTYVNTCKCMSVIINIIGMIVNLMDATIDNAKQRTKVLYILNFVKKEMEGEFNDLNNMIARTLEKMHKHGLDQNAPAAEITRYILDQGTEEEIEALMLESLPKLEHAQQRFLTTFTTLQNKGYVT